ncbi:MAG: delta-class carbonic anhydrase [Enterovibrio sp.]
MKGRSMKKHLLATSVFLACFASLAIAKTSVDNELQLQREALTKNTMDQGFGPQSPRDIDDLNGKNQRHFSMAPHPSKMNLCNIHFHKNAEHKGGEFTEYAGNGLGYKYNKTLSKQELTPFNNDFKIQSGDTIEVHYVYSTAQVKPGPTLGACLSESIVNPQLRVETQVYVLVNDKAASDFSKLTKVGLKNGYYQALNIPNNTGTPIVYAGSTTGPSYNEKGSPLQVTWSVRPKVQKTNIASVALWLKGNAFNEDRAHGVRTLVVDPALLSNGHQ